MEELDRQIYEQLENYQFNYNDQSYKSLLKCLLTSLSYLSTQDFKKTDGEIVNYFTNLIRYAENGYETAQRIHHIAATELAENFYEKHIQLTSNAIVLKNLHQFKYEDFQILKLILDRYHAADTLKLQLLPKNFFQQTNRLKYLLVDGYLGKNQTTNTLSHPYRHQVNQEVVNSLLEATLDSDGWRTCAETIINNKHFKKLYLLDYRIDFLSPKVLEMALTELTSNSRFKELIISGEFEHFKNDQWHAVGLALQGSTIQKLRIDKSILDIERYPQYEDFLQFLEQSKLKKLSYRAYNPWDFSTKKKNEVYSILNDNALQAQYPIHYNMDGAKNALYYYMSKLSSIFSTADQFTTNKKHDHRNFVTIKPGFSETS